MVITFIQSLILLVTQFSIESLIRGYGLIVERLHVLPDHGVVVERFDRDIIKKQSRKGQSPPTEVDSFENPYFNSTEYKDDRALAKLDNTASHAKRKPHPKDCECKPCRDGRPTFPNACIGRYRGHRKATKKQRWARLDLDSILPSAFPQIHISRIPHIKLRLSELWSDALLLDDPISPIYDPSSPSCPWTSQKPLKESRLRGGDLKVLDPRCNRFAALDVERTKDEDEDEVDHEHNKEQDQYHDLDESPIDPLDSPLDLRAGDDTERSLSPHRLTDLAALLSNKTDDELHTTDSEADSSHSSTSLPASPIAKPRTNKRGQPHAPHPSRHETSTFPSDHAIDSGSQTANDKFKHVPWEEDDWAERKVSGVKASGWTRTRILCRCTLGEGVKVFGGEEMR